MDAELQTIIASVDAITSVHDVPQLETLDRALVAFFAHPDAARHVSVWFRLFERFPDDDGYESFWSILHGLESLPNYEPELIASLRRRPSQFTVMMINRLLNAGHSEVADVSLLFFLESLAADRTCAQSVREQALRYVAYQQSRS